MKLPEGLYYPTYRDKKTGELKRSAIIWARYFRGGKKHFISTETANIREAKKFRERCVGGAKPITTALKRTTFEDLAAFVTSNYAVNELRSLKRIKEALAHLRVFFGADLARDITTDRISEYILWRRDDQKASNATINRELSALRRGFKLAAQTSPPRVDIVPFFPHLKEASARKGFFEREELDQVLAHLPAYLKTPLTVSFITGWRTPSEVLTRQKQHLNLDAGVLRLEPGETKNGEPREFPVDAIPELREILDAQLALTRKLEVETGSVIPWLFHNNGKPIRQFYRRWHTACAKAGLSGKVPHDFRRTAARNLIRAGVPTLIAKRLTGHLTDAVFARYGIIDRSMLDDATAKLAIVLQADQKRPAKVVAIGTKDVSDKVGRKSNPAQTSPEEKSA